MPDLPEFARCFSHHCLPPFNSLCSIYASRHFQSEEIKMSWFENVTAPLDAMRVRHNVTKSVENPGFG